MFGFSTIKNMSPQQVKQGLEANEIILIDVREDNEFSAEHIKGALSFPLSRLDPSKLPVPPEGQYLVFQCAGGVRSAKAVTQCKNAGLCVEQHLAGGIAAWKAAGFPTTR